MKPYFLITPLLAALALPLHAQTASPADSPAATAQAASPAPAATPEKAHFGGTLTSVDATGKTVTVVIKKQGTKTFQVTDSTKITKTDGTAITLGDLKAGDHVHGAFTTTADGKLELLTLKAGPKEP